MKSREAAPVRRHAHAEPHEPSGPRPSFWRWLGAQDWLLAIALAAFVAVVVWFAHSIRDFLEPDVSTLSLPSLVGETESDAVAEAQRLRLNVDIAARETSDRYPLGVVMRQDPPAGAQVRQGRRISLVVSKGIELITVPDLRYESMREVNLDLSHLRLQTGKVRMVGNDDVPAGRVVVQDPVPGTSVRQGSAISLQLSKGPPDVVSAPRLIGLDIDAAREEAARARIQIGQIVWTPFGANGPARGVVVRQSPDAGSRIDPFARVSLQVSAGPNVTGYLVRQVHATVTVPDGDAPKRVRVAVRDDTGASNAFDGYAQPRARLDFTVTAVGSADIDTYVDGELLNSTKIGAEPPSVQRDARAGGHGDAAAAQAQSIGRPVPESTFGNAKR